PFRSTQDQAYKPNRCATPARKHVDGSKIPSKPTDPASQDNPNSPRGRPTGQSLSTTAANPSIGSTRLPPVDNCCTPPKCRFRVMKSALPNFLNQDPLVGPGPQQQRQAAA